jgi:hypothetical protein
MGGQQPPPGLVVHSNPYKFNQILIGNAPPERQCTPPDAPTQPPSGVNQSPAFLNEWGGSA